MAKKIRTCIICHKKYSYCPSCAADANKPTWMFVFCSENCRAIYNVINDYRYKKLSKEEAAQKLGELDLSCSDVMIEDFQNVISEILESDSADKKEAAEEAETANKAEAEEETEKEPEKKKPVRKRVSKTKETANSENDLD